jgi:hypothetical protein
MGLKLLEILLPFPVWRSMTPLRLFLAAGVWRGRLHAAPWVLLFLPLPPDLTGKYSINLGCPHALNKTLDNRFDFFSRFLLDLHRLTLNPCLTLSKVFL